jgi:hypothetical protein
MLELKNTVWSYLRLQIYHVCDAIVREFSFATGNYVELAQPVQLTGNTSGNKNMATKVAPNSSSARKSTDQLAPVPPARTITPHKKRISDISQMRLDAYVARTAEQAVKKKNVQT